jgi:hypothetical protein
MNEEKRVYNIYKMGKYISVGGGKKALKQYEAIL